ncbi:MAG: hypothetical protein Q8N98_05170, partial [bacterium]|nr:hypothetical protein [bacterium]
AISDAPAGHGITVAPATFSVSSTAPAKTLTVKAGSADNCTGTGNKCTLTVTCGSKTATSTFSLGVYTGVIQGRFRDINGLVTDAALLNTKVAYGLTEGSLVAATMDNIVCGTTTNVRGYSAVNLAPGTYMTRVDLPDNYKLDRDQTYYTKGLTACDATVHAYPRPSDFDCDSGDNVCTITGVIVDPGTVNLWFGVIRKDYTLTLLPTDFSVIKGDSAGAPATLTVTPTGGWTGPVSCTAGITSGTSGVIVSAPTPISSPTALTQTLTVKAGSADTCTGTGSKCTLTVTCDSKIVTSTFSLGVGPGTLQGKFWNGTSFYGAGAVSTAAVYYGLGTGEPSGSSTADNTAICNSAAVRGYSASGLLKGTYRLKIVAPSGYRIDTANTFYTNGVSCSTAASFAPAWDGSCVTIGGSNICYVRTVYVGVGDDGTTPESSRNTINLLVGLVQTDYSLTATPDTLPVIKGNTSGPVTVAITPTGGWSQAVTVNLKQQSTFGSCSSSDEKSFTTGITPNWSPATKSISPTTPESLTFMVGSSVPTGAYYYCLKTADNKTKALTLTVTDKPGTIKGKIWFDTDADGVKDAGENPVGNTVDLGGYSLTYREHGIGSSLNFDTRPTSFTTSFFSTGTDTTVSAENGHTITLTLNGTDYVISSAFFALDDTANPGSNGVIFSNASLSTKQLTQVEVPADNSTTRIWFGVSRKDYVLTATPDTLPVIKGNTSGPVTVAITPTGGWNTPVSLTLKEQTGVNCPGDKIPVTSGITPSWTTKTVSPTTPETLTFAVSSSVPAGSYYYCLSSSDGKTESITLTVTEKPGTIRGKIWEDTNGDGTMKDAAGSAEPYMDNTDVSLGTYNLEILEYGLPEPDDWPDFSVQPTSFVGNDGGCVSSGTDICFSEKVNLTTGANGHRVKLTLGDSSLYVITSAYWAQGPNGARIASGATIFANGTEKTKIIPKPVLVKDTGSGTGTTYLWIGVGRKDYELKVLPTSQSVVRPGTANVAHSIVPINGWTEQVGVRLTEVENTGAANFCSRAARTFPPGQSFSTGIEPAWSSQPSCPGTLAINIRQEADPVTYYFCLSSADGTHGAPFAVTVTNKPGLIKTRIWEDKDANGIKDVGEEFVGDTIVNGADGFGGYSLEYQEYGAGDWSPFDYAPGDFTSDLAMVNVGLTSDTPPKRHKIRFTLNTQSLSNIDYVISNGFLTNNDNCGASTGKLFGPEATTVREITGVRVPVPSSSSSTRLCLGVTKKDFNLNLAGPIDLLRGEQVWTPAKVTVTPIPAVAGGWTTAVTVMPTLTNCTGVTVEQPSLSIGSGDNWQKNFNLRASSFAVCTGTNNLTASSGGKTAAATITLSAAPGVIAGRFFIDDGNKETDPV